MGRNRDVRSRATLVATAVPLGVYGFGPAALVADRSRETELQADDAGVGLLRLPGPGRDALTGCSDEAPGSASDGVVVDEGAVRGQRARRGDLQLVAVRRVQLRGDRGAGSGE